MKRDVEAIYSIGKLLSVCFERWRVLPISPPSMRSTLPLEQLFQLWSSKALESQWRRCMGSFHAVKVAVFLLEPNRSSVGCTSDRRLVLVQRQVLL
jgi:hypothetical protein